MTDTEGNAWVEQLGRACEMLTQAPYAPVMEVHIFGRLAGEPGSARSVLLVTRRFAAEHGLDQRASLEGRVLHLHLRRASHGLWSTP